MWRPALAGPVCALQLLQQRSCGVWQRHRVAGGVVVADHDRLAVRKLLIAGRVDDLVDQPEARPAEIADRQTDFQLVAEMRRRAVVAFRARDDDSRMRCRAAGQLAPERQAALLEIGEIDGVIDVPHRVAVAEAHREAMTIGNMIRHARYNIRPPWTSRPLTPKLSRPTKHARSRRTSPTPIDRCSR